MSTMSKLLLSGSTDGRMIKVAATATPGTLIHTAVTGVVDFDEVWLYAVNSGAVDKKLTIEFGGVTAPDDLIEKTIPTEDGLLLIVPGWVLQNAKVIRAFAATADLVLIGGFVNRITV